MEGSVGCPASGLTFFIESPHSEIGEHLIFCFQENDEDLTGIPRILQKIPHGAFPRLVLSWMVSNVAAFNVDGVTMGVMLEGTGF